MTILRSILVILPLLVLLLIAGAREANAATVVGIYLFPSPQTVGSANYVRLACGWHMDCTYEAPDDPAWGALDFWTASHDDHLGTRAEWRATGYDSDSVTAREVGRIVRVGLTHSSQCDYAYGEMYRLNGTYIGRAMYLHVTPYSTMTRYIYGQKYTGYQNSNTWGTEADDSVGCSWTGYHIHQDSQLNYPNVVTDYHRGSYPRKGPPPDCFQCGTPYTIWTYYHVGFHYYR